MKIVIPLLLTIFSCRTLETGKPVSIHISYDDETVFIKEDICRDIFHFKKEFQKKFPESNLYYYIMPKINIAIEFDNRYLSEIFNSDASENREIINMYYMELEKMFPKLEKSIDMNRERPEITVSLSACDYPEHIVPSIRKLSIEYKERRAEISYLSRIQTMSEHTPEKKKYQIEIKIFLKNTSVTEREIRRYMKQIKTLDNYSHEIKIFQ